MAVASDRGYDVAVEEGIAVPLPSGATFFVLTQDEADYLNERVRRYLSDNHFVNVSDFQDIDKMVTFELFIHRWTLWMSRNQDYYGDQVDGKQLAAQVNSYSTELRLLKKNLGMDKVARDRARGDDSWAAYHQALLQRAKEFGINRDAMSAKAIELFQQMRSLITYHDNADDTERHENHVTQDDIFEWLREVAIPEFEELDKNFREGKQKMWIRKM